MIKVIGQGSGDKAWATISYGWESAKYYAKWMHGAAAGEDFCGASLDPLNPQSVQAEAFLELFKKLLRDKNYASRLKRHYTLFRKVPRVR
jgi:hypothetical protein